MSSLKTYRYVGREGHDFFQHRTSFLKVEGVIKGEGDTTGMHLIEGSEDVFGLFIKIDRATALGGRVLRYAYRVFQQMILLGQTDIEIIHGVMGRWLFYIDAGPSDLLIFRVRKDGGASLAYEGRMKLYGECITPFYRNFVYLGDGNILTTAGTGPTPHPVEVEVTIDSMPLIVINTGMMSRNTLFMTTSSELLILDREADSLDLIIKHTDLLSLVGHQWYVIKLEYAAAGIE